MSADILKSLLARVQNILEQNRAIEKLRGENFNLFTILDRRNDEVKTHSALLAELLNPQGSHGQGSIFLNHFFDLLAKKTKQNINSADIDHTTVAVEKNVGNILGINSRLDIYLSNKDTQICIENKIYAGDQPNQLERYKEFLARNTAKNNLLIYLTLDAKTYENPNKENPPKKLVEGEDYFTLSYSEDILHWLQACLKESVEFPILRESIRQYIILIKGLTNQLVSDKMQEEIHKAILADIESAWQVQYNYYKAIEYFKSRVISKLKSVLPNYQIEARESGKFSAIDIRKSANSEPRISIESFNTEGHFGGALFIGILEMGLAEDDAELKCWRKGSIIEIYSKSALIEKIRAFGKGKETEVVNELAEKIAAYITEKWG